MIVLNSVSSERIPTVITDLVSAYPMDNGLHCCVTNPRYVKVLMIRSNGNRLYNYFASKGSLITILDIDPLVDDISLNIGRYNLVAIDLEEGTIPKKLLEKYTKQCRDNRVSFLIHSDTEEDIYVYGGHFVKSSSFLLDEDIVNSLSSGFVFVTNLNTVQYGKFLEIQEGALDVALDTRTSAYSISVDVAPSKKSGVISVMSTYYTVQNLVDVRYNNSTNCFTLRVGNKEINSKPIGFDSFKKITITVSSSKTKLYLESKLIAELDSQGLSTKATNTIIGKNAKVTEDTVSTMLVKNLCIYAKELSLKEVKILADGRLIMT